MEETLQTVGNEIFKEETALQALDRSNRLKKGEKKTVFNRSPYYFNAAQQVIGVNLLDISEMDANTMVRFLSEIDTKTQVPNYQLTMA